MSDKSKQTIIEDGTEFDGIVVSECGITLSGKLKGDVTAPSLTVNTGGTVDGTVRVESLVSQGQISGEIEADTVQLGGKVSDRTVIRANTLEVKLNPGKGGHQVTFGECELKVGNVSSKMSSSQEKTHSGAAKPETPVGSIDQPPQRD